MPRTAAVAAPSLVPDWPALAVDPAALLSAVAGFYAGAAQSSPEAAGFLRRRGLDHLELMAHFGLGVAQRGLGLWLPDRQTVAGAQVRSALQRLGVLKASGHELYAGSLVVPVRVPSAGSGQAGAVVQLYGRKLADRQREGVALEVWLPGPVRGVFNAEGLRGAEDVVLCGSLLDALTVWCAGERRVTAACGDEVLGDDVLQALVSEGVRRVRLAFAATASGDARAQAAAAVLSSVGIATLRVTWPAGRDANALCVQSGLPAVLRAVEDAAPWSPPPAAPAAVAALARAPTPASVSASDAPACATDADCEVSAEQVVVRFEDRRYRVRGLSRALGAESMKVNVMVSACDATPGAALHIDTFDLYQAKAREAFVRQAASALSLDPALIARDVARLLLRLEALQAEAIRSAVAAAPVAPALSAADEAAGLALLRDPDLVRRIVRDVAAVGVVGEDANALLGYLACVSRKLEKPLAVLIQSTSAAGKSTLMDALLSLMPEAERVHYSAMTGQSLFYLGEGDLRHKILAIAEEEGVRQAAYALKLLQSQGELTIASTGKDPQTGKLVTEEYRVQGPVMLCLTTTAIDIDEELLNRCLVLSIDESREQTQAIHARQRQARTLAGLIASHEGDAVRRSHRAAQALLRPFAVVNPFAESLTFRSASTRTRRDHAKYLTLIDAIALLHQQQRPVKTAVAGEGVIEYVEATASDIALADALLAPVLGAALEELPPQTRRVLGVVVELVRGLMRERRQERSAVRFTRREVRAEAGMTDTALRVHLERLVTLEYLLVHRGQRGQSFVYELLYAGEVATEVAGVATEFAPSAAEFAPSAAEFAPGSHPQRTPNAGGAQVAEIDESHLETSGSGESAAKVSPSARRRSVNGVTQRSAVQVGA
jgi:energy-coupling factor transporter ATP-binding protein EcfA2